MNVLSIDLDYIMWPDINFYNSMLYDANPTIRWKKMESYFKDSNDTKRTYNIDQANLMFVFNTFLKAIKMCNSVSFGYEHDAILYELEKEKYTDIDLYHIDHHDDFLNGHYGENGEGYEGFAKEYYFMENQYMLDEGNWGAWLHIQKKLSSFLWIHNPNVVFSLDQDRWKYVYDKMEGEFYMHKRGEVEENIHKVRFDHIFVCLSPQYIPPEHWHYFGMFINAYEEFTGKEANIHVNKYGRIRSLSPVHDKIVNNYS